MRRRARLFPRRSLFDDGHEEGISEENRAQQIQSPSTGGIIKLREDDELIDVSVSQTGDDILLATANGMAIRFDESDVRPTGRNTSGVKGITLRKNDFLVGMVVVDPEATLLTACENGFGKRTTFRKPLRPRTRPF
jgi:DNA gyrase subunit A